MSSFTTFHQITMAKAGPVEAPSRAPLAREVRPYSAADPWFAPLLYHDHCYKWWAVEVRFDQPLSASTVRWLQREACDPWRTGIAGADGIVWDQWWNKWPSKHDDEWLLALLRRIGGPGCVRAAPFGRDCSGDWSCPAALDEPHRCELGVNWSAAPTFRYEDWRGVDFRRVNGV